MSRIGKLPIIIPQGVTVNLNDRVVKVVGPKGTLEYEHSPLIKVTTNDADIRIELAEDNQKARELWGLVRTLLSNMIEGVSKGFEKQLEIVGIGYRAQMQGSKLVLNVGYSHPVDVVPPEGINLKVEKNTITVSGFDKQLVGEVAAKIRSVRKPEPYKGKGIKYSNEYIRRKAGKAAKAR
ncbi:TPA: 50S ribosomal protein L6 [candidate division CPR2 bacterium]|uniref:Large ribosomal subunit protein uL6 n=1 Tax=candidate division CPR2 bacterium GW2011_GWC1_41_48 TaxID=1618344 RepID=A0A0G0YH24_UNCC2|nr:MAG: 50S ribosomal protein L6 [candidate division CPR2 bacterium GW2011_GWC2_39_35]KKR27165.1 MAG: 50S ribosomal protein L6 [candidate division CPR2 bacterium GW2011_GWD2_39_7]KKR27390.1 MAG: 50S ribosomal protein L6 [candidate division CPR2 bacterium GW2011_GWD1_39_7]KKS08851.1 MAG: 50S ribosomal protein L6 [candidate division CPR2 bacterium GW2011_GWC1_41_48]OGB58563.1 MAG: 50S ribosomal protein L6 [candidate division CPR2 bacterium GWD1_39_7]OGB70314.1 MAG: 50S ribosomal protein L6 [cand